MYYNTIWLFLYSSIAEDNKNYLSNGDQIVTL